MTNSAGSIRTEAGIVFGTADGAELKLDVHRPPTSRGNGACVIELFGGGWVRGHRAGHYDGAFRRFAALGYVCVAPDYRLAPGTKWPGQLEDVKAAVGWVKDNAQRLGIDPAKIVLAGYSAGAQLAMIASADADLGIAACVVYYPANVKRQEDGSNHPLVAAGSSDEGYDDLQPVSHLRAGYPPTFIICGTSDRFHDHVTQLYEKLRGFEVPVELHLLAGQDHIFDRNPEFADISRDWCHQFMDRYVVNPRDYPAYQRPAPVTA
ncbi:MAG TPA: alpha/beta hydrolase [Dehalococcoidia bacterium]|nr:alpha/beta hydrolase [Dehalococcoidia bacterium]